jgi:hypothetical protein
MKILSIYKYRCCMITTSHPDHIEIFALAEEISDTAEWPGCMLSPVSVSSSSVSYPQILFPLLTDWSGHEQVSPAEFGGF